MKKIRGSRTAEIYRADTIIALGVAGSESFL